MVNQFEKVVRESYPDGLTWQKTVPTVHPESGEEASDLFRQAKSYSQKLFISGFCNNIDPVGKDFDSLVVIKADRLNDIIEVNEKDFYMTVGAGYPLKECNKVLSARKLWFPFGDSNYPGSCGGAVAAGLSGSDGHHPVPLSRFLLAVLAVLPDGSVVTPGALTFKSVSGYDISRLFFNSWGQIGMVISLSFRVLPLNKKREHPRIVVLRPDRETFRREMAGNGSSARILREIKRTYDPDNLLPIV